MFSKQKPNTPTEWVHDFASRVLIMLSAMFVLGMGVNLLGLPAEAEGTAQTTSAVLLGFHGLIGIGLIVGSIIITVQATKVGSAIRTWAWVGLITILVTFVSGVLTLSLDNDWLSYLMALGFLVSFWLYGSLYVKTKLVK